MLSIFSYVSGPSVCLPWRIVCSSPLPIFELGCLSFWSGVFIYFGDQTLVWGFTGKYVFPYCWFSFYFNVVFFSHAEAFYFDEVPFVYSFLYVPCLRGHVCEDVAAWNVWDFPANVFLKDFYGVTTYIRVFYPSWVYFRVWRKLVIEFHFFARSCPDLPTPSVEEAVFAPFYAPASFVKY